MMSPDHSISIFLSYYHFETKALKITHKLALISILYYCQVLFDNNVHYKYCKMNLHLNI
ncbi:hypothetical protein LEQ41_08225 [Streptococcus agalactiae]|nr:hypothetical protein [Streptococcus agalactiae]